MYQTVRVMLTRRRGSILLWVLVAPSLCTETPLPAPEPQLTPAFGMFLRSLEELQQYRHTPEGLDYLLILVFSI